MLALAMVVVIAVGLRSGPAGFGSGGRGADAAQLDEVRKLFVSDAGALDAFGVGVAASGDTAVVGAGAAAYIFQRDQGGTDNWGQVTKLTASDAEGGDGFGGGVAVSGDTVVVGGSGGGGTGAAYVFQRDQGGADNWGELTKLTASDAEGGDLFGQSVAVSGDTAVVGAHWEDAGGSSAGAAYVFQRDQGGADNWGELTKLTASDAEGGDDFGYGVAVSGDTVVVGAILQDDGGYNAGAAYVFQRDQGGADNWGELTKLAAFDAQANDNFGFSVAASGDTAVVGTYAAGAVGAAYIFQRDQGGAGNWGQVTKLTASDAERGDLFGYSAAVSGDTAVVGARDEDAGGSNAGAAYIFQRDQGGADNWGEVKKLTASDAEDYDWFGLSVAVSGETAVVGAPGKDVGGAAYVFGQGVTPPPTPTPASELTVEAQTEGRFIATEPADTASVSLRITVQSGEVPVTDASVFVDNFQVGVTDVNGELLYQYQLAATPFETTRIVSVAALKDELSGSASITLYSSELIGQNCSVVIGGKLQQALAEFFNDPLNYAHIVVPGAQLLGAANLLKVLLLLAAEGYFADPDNAYEPETGDSVRVEVYEYSADGVTTAYAVRMSVKRDGLSVLKEVVWTEDSTHNAFNGCPIASTGFGGSLASPVSLTIVDPAGRQAAYDPENGELTTEFEVYVTPNDIHPTRFFVPSPVEGEYRIQLVGVGSGEVTLYVVGFGSDGGTTHEDTYSFGVVPGQTSEFAVSIESDGTVSDVNEVEPSDDDTPTPPPTPTPTAVPQPPKGDVNCDGNVDVGDTLQDLRYGADLPVSQNGGCPPIGSEYNSIFGDMDCDEDVDAVDALWILRYVAVMPLTLPQGCAALGE